MTALLRKIQRTALSLDRRQYAAFGVISLAAIGLTAILSFSRATISEPYLGNIPGSPSGFFEPFFGDLPPLLMVSAIAVVGAFSLGYLYSRGWFEILPEKGVRQGLLFAAIVGTLLGLEAILVEASGFASLDDDINVRLPWSLLFYPVIAYVVEVIFHLVPLALLLAVFGSRVSNHQRERLIWICILIVSIIEPVFQVEWGEGFSRTEAWVLAQVFAVNIAQLYAFRRYGFVSMLSLRLAYYSWWHVIWGYFRLQWIF